MDRVRSRILRQRHDCGQRIHRNGHKNRTMADPNTPTWLTESSAPAAISGPEPVVSEGLQTSTTRASGNVSTNAEDDQELPGVILTMRLANMAAAIALVVFSVRTKMRLAIIYNCCTFVDKDTHVIEHVDIPNAWDSGH